MDSTGVVSLVVSTASERTWSTIASGRPTVTGPMASSGTSSPSRRRSLTSKSATGSSAARSRVTCIESKSKRWTDPLAVCTSQQPVRSPEPRWSTVFTPAIMAQGADGYDNGNDMTTLGLSIA